MRCGSLTEASQKCTIPTVYRERARAEDTDGTDGASQTGTTRQLDISEPVKGDTTAIHERPPHSMCYTALMASRKGTRGSAVLPEDGGSTLPVWGPAFLMCLAMWNNVGDACEKAGISRKTAYEHRLKNVDLRQRWAAASAQAIDRLRREAWRRAMSRTNPSDKLLMFLLRAHDPIYRTDSVNFNVGPTYVLQLDGVEYRLRTKADVDALPTDVMQKVLANRDLIRIEEQDKPLAGDGQDFIDGEYTEPGDA